MSNNVKKLYRVTSIYAENIAALSIDEQKSLNVVVANAQSGCKCIEDLAALIDRQGFHCGGIQDDSFVPVFSSEARMLFILKSSVC